MLVPILVYGTRGYWPTFPLTFPALLLYNEIPENTPGLEGDVVRIQEFLVVFL